MTRYRTIVADPPWDHSDGTGVDIRGGGRVTHLPYATMTLTAISSLPVLDLSATMTLTAISSLPVLDLSDNVGADAHLYLWTTSRYLRDAFDVTRAWGFHYAATLVWCKASRGWSTGGSYQNNVEFILFAKRPKVVRRPQVLALTTRLAELAAERGITRRDVDAAMGTTDMGGWWLSTIEHRCACPTNDQWLRLRDLLGAGELDGLVAELNAEKFQPVEMTPQVETSRWFTWPRGDHSAKPDAFMDMVERVSPPPRLEMFARRQRLGWDTWGDQALPHVELPA